MSCLYFGAGVPGTDPQVITLGMWKGARSVTEEYVGSKLLQRVLAQTMEGEEAIKYFLPVVL